MDKQVKRIALINIYQGAVNRGLETFAQELSTRLGADLISGGEKPLPRWPVVWRVYLDPHGIQTCISTLKQIKKLVRGKYDIVVPLNGGWQPVWIRLLTWATKAKMVVVGESGIGWDDRTNLWCFPDVFVAISSRAKAWAKEVNRHVDVKYIPNGVDVTKFSPIGSKYRLPFKNGKTVLVVGALTKTKGIAGTIRAVAKLEKTNLLVVGKGPLKKKLTRLGKKLLGERFAIKSFSHESMPLVYRACNVFTLVSHDREAFGIVYLEAMASGLGVVATDDNQRREIVGEAGDFVSPGAIDAYATKLKLALTKNWGKAPSMQAAKFSWEKVAKRYEKLVNKL